jgi:hypothetical protein
MIASNESGTMQIEGTAKHETIADIALDLKSLMVEVEATGHELRWTAPNDIHEDLGIELWKLRG